jgi:hypothetical protein
MAHAFHLKIHDRRPILSGQAVREDDGEPLDLGQGTALASSVHFYMRASGAATPLISNPGTIMNASLGRLGYFWLSGETATAGAFEGEFELRLAAGASITLTVPNHGYIPITIGSQIA